MAAKKGPCKRWSRAKNGKRRCLKRLKRPRTRGGYRRAKSRARGSYRRGHRPFNKGKRCKAFGVNRKGVVTCMSYGGRPGKRSRSRVYGPQQAKHSAAWWQNMMGGDNFVERSVGGLGSYRRSRRSRR